MNNSWKQIVAEALRKAVEPGSIPATCVYIYTDLYYYCFDVENHIEDVLTPFGGTLEKWIATHCEWYYRAYPYLPAEYHSRVIFDNAAERCSIYNIKYTRFLMTTKQLEWYAEYYADNVNNTDVYKEVQHELARRREGFMGSLIESL